MMERIIDPVEIQAVRDGKIVGETYRDGDTYAEVESLRAFRKMEEEARALKIRSQKEWGE